MFVRVPCVDCGSEMWIDLAFNITRTAIMCDEEETMYDYTIKNIEVKSCMTDKEFKEHLQKDVLILRERGMSNNELVMAISNYYGVAKHFSGDLLSNIPPKNKSSAEKLKVK